MKTKSRLPNYLWILIAAVIGGCAEPIVTLLNEDGSIIIEYECNNIKPQIESTDEIQVLTRYLSEVARDLRESKKIVSLLSLTSAVETQDYRKMEIEIVSHLCAKKKKPQ